jgi:metallophosphoesterase (TIGR00282 family)
MLRIMTIGDVTSPTAASALADKLWEIRRAHRIDFLAINPENAGFIIGPSADTAKMLLDRGADLLTGGNHTLQNQSLHALLDSDERLIRPANLPAEAPGAGYTILSANGYRLLAVNVLGRVEMEPVSDSPFAAIEKILAREEGNYDLAILDVHAEASGEKVALGVHFDGRFAAIYGTHTHVPTADLTVLPLGTGYVSDVGMCGASGGILGISKESVLRFHLKGIPTRYAVAEGELFADAVIFTVDPAENKCTALERVRLSLS